MKNFRLILPASLALLLFNTGCQTTGDPMVDTIWFSPEKAQKNIDQQRQALHAEQLQLQGLQRESVRLQQQDQMANRQLQDLQNAVDAEQTRLDSLRKMKTVPDGEYIKLKQQLDNARHHLDDLAGDLQNKIRTSEQAQAEKTRLQAQIADVHKRILFLLGEPPIEDATLDLHK